MSSSQSKFTYCGISFLACLTECETKEQYVHLVGQNGIEIYKLNESGFERQKIYSSPLTDSLQI